MKILMSALAVERHAAAIRKVAPDAELIPVPPEGPLPDPRGATIAFTTRDLIEKGTRENPAPEIRRFAELLGGARDLQWVHVHAAGVDGQVLRQLASRPEIRLTTSAGASAPAVAQSVLAGMLALARHFPLLAELQRRRAWEPLYLKQPLPRSLRGQQVLVVGTGPIGQEVGRLCQAFGMRSLGARRSPEAGLPPGFDEVCAYRDLARLLPRADWLVLACPLTDETRYLIDARALALLPEGAGLINVARGNVVVEEDMVAALRGGRLLGAYLDVFAREPLPKDSPLWDMPNVLISPHSAAAMEGLPYLVAELFCENLRRWIAGEPLRNLVSH